MNYGARNEKPRLHHTSGSRSGLTNSLNLLRTLTSRLTSHKEFFTAWHSQSLSNLSNLYHNLATLHTEAGTVLESLVAKMSSFL